MPPKSLVIAVALVAGLATAAVAAGPGAASSAPKAGGPAAAVSAAPKATLTGTTPVSSDYVIGPEDVLQVSVWKNDALSRQLPVRPDGKISLPLLQDIQAAGLTPMQLRDKIVAALAEFIPNPEVSVGVVEVRSYHISVLGEVQKPGVLQLKSPTTILEAIALAGGFRDFASPSKIVIFRKDGSGATHKIKFNYNRAVSNASEPNITLVSGDVVVVP